MMVLFVPWSALQIKTGLLFLFCANNADLWEEDIFIRPCVLLMVCSVGGCLHLFLNLIIFSRVLQA